MNGLIPRGTQRTQGAAHATSFERDKCRTVAKNEWNKVKF